jgi:hypothetical protein
MNIWFISKNPDIWGFFIIFPVYEVLYNIPPPFLPGDEDPRTDHRPMENH